MNYSKITLRQRVARQQPEPHDPRPERPRPKGSLRAERLEGLRIIARLERQAKQSQK